VGKTTVCKRVAELARGLGYDPAGLLSTALLDKDGLPVAYHALMVSDGEQRLLAQADGDLSGPRTGRYSFDADVFPWVIDRLRAAISQGCDLLIVDEIGPLELEQGKALAPILSDLSRGEIGVSRNGSPPQVCAPESRTARLSLRPELRPRGSPKSRSGVLCHSPNKVSTGSTQRLGTPASFHADSKDSRLLWDSPARWELPPLLLVVRPELVRQLRRRLSNIPFRTFTVTQENRQTLPGAIVEELFADHDRSR